MFILGAVINLQLPYHQEMKNNYPKRAQIYLDKGRAFSNLEGGSLLIVTSVTSRGQCCSLREFNLLENSVHFFLHNIDSLMQTETNFFVN